MLSSNNLPEKICKITTIQYFQTNTIDDLSEFFTNTKLLIRHQTQQHSDCIFDAVNRQVLSQ